MSEYSIKDLERLSGIKAHTIRIWEKRYNLLSPERTATNIRYYTDADLKLMLNIAILRRSGLKISKIAEMSSAELTDKVNENSEVDSSYDTAIENLLIATMEFDAERFNHSLDVASDRIGFEQAVIQIVYPFFKRIGVLWLLGSINPAQEHFISNLIRQKFIVSADKLKTALLPNAKCFLLFLSEGELHELGLLFYNYLIIKAGHKVLYLGQSLPLDAAREAAMQVTVDYVVTSVFSEIIEAEIIKKLSKISDYFPKTPIILTNRIEFDIKNVRIKHVHYNLSLEAFNEILEA